jgi:DNA-binding NtrC family response regulator
MNHKQKSRILIVEDDGSMGLLLGRSLEQLGYEIAGTVKTGEDAVLAVKECPPDLVLMDIILSRKMNGIEAAEQIRLFSKVPVVYITGHTDIDQWNKAKITEPFGYILKPFELRELDVVIAAAFYKYRKEQEIFSIKNRFHSCLENFGGVVIYSDLDLKPFLVEGPVEHVMGYKPG